MSRTVAVETNELTQAIRVLRSSAAELTRLAVEAPQGMPAMNPAREYAVYHELRSISLEMEKIARELDLDAAIQDWHLVRFGQVDEPVTGILLSLLGELADQAGVVQAADSKRSGIDLLLNPIDRAEHFGEGAVDFIKGLAGTAWMLEQGTNEYGLFDPRGHSAAVAKENDIVGSLLKLSPLYALWDPSDYLRNALRVGYGIGGGEYLWNGDGDKWLGNLFPQLLLAAATDGGSGAVMVPAELADPAAIAVASGERRAASAVAPDATIEVPDLAAVIDDLDAEVPGMTDLAQGGGLKKAWDYFNDIDMFAHSPIRLPWETDGATSTDPGPPRP